MKIGDKVTIGTSRCYNKVEGGKLLGSSVHAFDGIGGELTVIAVNCKIPYTFSGGGMNDTIVVNRRGEVLFVLESALNYVDPKAAERENARKKLQEIEDTARELRTEFNL